MSKRKLRRIDVSKFVHTRTQKPLRARSLTEWQECHCRLGTARTRTLLFCKEKEEIDDWSRKAKQNIGSKIFVVRNRSRLSRELHQQERETTTTTATLSGGTTRRCQTSETTERKKMNFVVDDKKCVDENV